MTEGGAFREKAQGLYSVWNASVLRSLHTVAWGLGQTARDPGNQRRGAFLAVGFDRGGAHGT